MMREIAQWVSAVLLCATAVVLIALQSKQLGWMLLALTAASLLFTERKFGRNVILLVVSLAILGVTPITTDISVSHMIVMGATLLAALCIPYVVSRYVYKDYLVRFPWHHGRNWYKSEVYYVGVTAVVAYFLLPFYLVNSGAYLNWDVQLDLSSITRLFIGTNALGIWDELFFVSTVLGILRNFFNFHIANVFQSVLFTSFLYELGFTGWGFAMIFIFALIQGYIFKHTESLLYVVTVHLVLDFVLFLALIYTHHPSALPIFIT